MSALFRLYYKQNFYLLCLTTSYTKIAAAAETFKDSIFPYWGILIC